MRGSRGILQQRFGAFRNGEVSELWGGPQGLTWREGMVKLCLLRSELLGHRVPGEGADLPW